MATRRYVVVSGNPNKHLLVGAAVTYPSLAAACTTEANGTANLVGNDIYLDIECYADAAPDTSIYNSTFILYFNTTTDATHFVRIYTPLSERHSGKYDTTKYRLELSPTVNGHMFVGCGSNTQHIRIEGLQFKWTSATYSGSVSSQIAGNGLAVFRECIFDNSSGNTGNSGLNTSNTVAVNCVFDSFTSQFYGAARTGSTTYLYNNTFYNCWGIRADSNIVARNNIIHASTSSAIYYAGSSFSTSFAGTDYNVLGAIPSGSGCVGKLAPHDYVNQNITLSQSFLNIDNHDFRLSPFDTSCRGKGTNLTTDPYWPPAPAVGNNYIDINGNTRPASGAWDIGVDQCQLTPAFSGSGLEYGFMGQPFNF